MSLYPLAFPDGIYRNGTEYESQNRWYDCNLIRFYDDTRRPLGGWRKKARESTLTSPFSTVNATPTITVAHTAHGLRIGDTLTFLSEGATVGGLDMTIATWTVATVPTADSYTFPHSSNATSTAGPAGGAVSYSYTQVLTGSGRAVIAWKDNTTTTWAAAGTHSKLYAMGRNGQLYDITPAGFTAGRADAVAVGGYGAGLYGADIYGSPRLDDVSIQDASVWTFDTWGQDLAGCMAEDGFLYEWPLNTAVAAAKITNAPTARGMFVTQEDIMMAGGASGNPRNMAWSDLENNTVWAPSATNQAGDFNLKTYGKFMLGRRVRGGNLIWTELDVHLATYTADVLVYSFSKLAEGCGAVSQNCVGVLENSAVWMGTSGFWYYNGFVQPLPCTVSDYVFSGINPNQISKVTCYVNSQYGEVTWHYPSGSSNENDRYVTWSYRAFASGKIVWTFGSIAREAGWDRGVFQYPLLIGTDGYVYEHEVGFAYDGASPYLESGPFQFRNGPFMPDNGDNVMYATRLVTDEKTAGDVTATFKVKFYPNGSEVSYGPYTSGNPVSVRFGGRQFKVRYTGAALADFRIGIDRLEVVPGGTR